MEDFWKSVQTIQTERGADYRAFSLFSATHWAELLGAAAVIFLCAVIYYRCREVTRHQILRAVFVLMLADEFMKQAVLLYTGQWNVTYLPLHLCSINIFVCWYDAIHQSRWSKEILYALCIPGAVPVLNEAGKLMGIITSSDVVELVDDEMSDDYAKLGGLTGEEDLRESVFESVKKRLPWLTALLFLGMLVSSVVGAFESVVAVLPVVICFQSMVLDMAGNVGTQSLAVTIRVLVDENLTVSKKFQLLWKEVRVGLLNGTILAVMELSFLGCYIHFFKGYAWNTALLLSGCVGASLVVAMVVSSLVGTLVPMLFHKIHIDPAVASGPLITTINDLVAVVVYYGLAMVVLIDLFHLA